MGWPEPAHCRSGKSGLPNVGGGTAIFRPPVCDCGFRRSALLLVEHALEPVVSFNPTIRVDVRIRAAWDRSKKEPRLADTLELKPFAHPSPALLYIPARHAHDLEEAFVRTVNDTKDNNTIVAIVGAAVGALRRPK